MISRSSAAYCSWVCVWRRSICLTSNMSVRTVPYVLPMPQADPSPDLVTGDDAPEPDASHDRPLTPVRQRRAAIASTVLYVGITAFLGRHLLAHLGTTVAHDAGDPLLTAAILKWNATHWPLTD